MRRSPNSSRYGQIRMAVVAVILACGSIVAPLVAAPTASASTCNQYSWNWPFCHLGVPSIPRVNMGGPRPPLTVKNSVWCTAPWVYAGGVTGWYRISTTKYPIRFWPDYYHNVYVGVVWNGNAWVQTRQPVYFSTDCDA